MQLTTMDIHQLIKNPTSVAYSTLAEKVAVAYTSGSFNETESAIASDIFRLLLRDAERSVRVTLAEHLCNDANAPHDVVMRLARDETDVAERILQYSMVLTDDDLASIVESTKEVLKLCAIARREVVSERISDALLDTEQEEVLLSLFNNTGANLSEDGLKRSWNIIAGNNSLLESLVKHGNLPVTIAEKIFSVVSNELRMHIDREYKFSRSTTYKAAIDAREWELLGIMQIGNIPHPDDDIHVDDLVDQLYATGRLTYSFVIRALCMGFLNLFEASLAKMADIHRANARILLTGGSDGFRALYSAAGMPEGFIEAVEKLLFISHKLTHYGYDKPNDFRKQLIENIYIGEYHRSIDGMSYLLSIIDGKISGGYASKALH